MDQAPTPVGAPCLCCAEPVQDGDQGLIMPCFGTPDLQPVHAECLQRMLFGSVAHQRGACICHGGSGEDDPALTRREAALAAVAEAERRRGCAECGSESGDHEDWCQDSIDTPLSEDVD